jgi:hypothetical protein
LNHESVTNEGQETAALFALSALSQLEASAFDIHLREGCTTCDNELKQFEQVVGILGSVAPPVAPPAYLRDLLIARIDREGAEAQSKSTAIPLPEQADAIRFKRVPARSFGVGWLSWAIAAALLVAFAYTFTALQSERRTLQAANERDRNASTEREEAARLKEELSKEKARATELTQINSVLSAAQWRVIPLSGQGPVPGASAKVYWDIQGKRWVVSADLPPPPEGKVYQLWFVTPDAKVSAGVLNLQNDGHGFAVVQIPPDITQIAAAAISIEPDGGSAQPTQVYLIGNAS